MYAFPARHGHLFAFIIAALLGLAQTGVLRAQPADGEPPGGPIDRTIYVPFKDLAEALKKHAATAIVPYDDYLRYLQGIATGKTGNPPADAIITSAAYTATVEGDLARIQAVYTVNVLGQPWVELPLTFGDAAVGSLEAAEEDVLLRGAGDGAYALLLGKAGEQTVTLELVARVRTSPDGRELSLSVPPVAVTTFELTVPESEQTIDVTPRLVAQPVEQAADTTTVKASLGSTTNITARWRPKASLKPEMELLASVTNRQLVTIEGGYIHHDAWLTYDVLRGSLPTLRIAVPLGERVLDVSADAGVKSWQAAEEAGRQVVTIELISPAEKSVTVEIHTERAQGDAAEPVIGLDAEGVAHGIHALDVVRESGQAALRVGEGLELTILEQQGLTRIAAAEVDERLKAGAAAAFKFYSPQVRLAVAARTIEPRILVSQTSQIIFDEDELRLEAALTYQVERAGVFELQLKAPDNLIIDDVESPQRQDDSFDETTRILTVRLQQSTQGQVDVTVRAHRPLEAGAGQAEQDLPVLEPLGAARETGFIYVFAPAGIEVVTNEANLQSVQPAPAAGQAAHGDASLQSAWSYSRRPVRIPVTTVRKPTRLSATIATAIDVQPQMIEVATSLTYLVEFAGVDTFRFLVPAAVSDTVQIEAVATGPESTEIKQKTAGAAEDGWVAWTVVMQRKVVGSQGLRVTYRIARAEAAAAPADAAPPPADAEPAAPAEDVTTIALVRPQGEPESADDAGAPLTQLKGEVRISRERSLSVTTQATGGDIEPIDIRELTLLPQEGASAYRYFQQPDDAALEVTLTRSRHDIQEVTPTVVEQALVEIATARHAAATFRCRFRIKTVERQRLRIDLPKELELLGVFVDGVEEKLSPVPAGEAGPAREDVTAYTVSIARRQRSAESFVLTVQFNWNINPAPFENPFGRGEMTLPLPRIGGSDAPAPVQQLLASVYVPRRFWLVGTPERFTVVGERDWWAGLTGDPVPRPGDAAAGFDNSVTAPLDFPTQGLVATRYQNLGGAAEINLVWWDTVKMTVLFSGALAIVAFILLRTSWENKLGILLLLAFVALLFGVRDQDALSHSLAAARLGLGFMIALWVLHGLLRRGASNDRGAVAAAPSPPSSA